MGFVIAAALPSALVSAVCLLLAASLFGLAVLVARLAFETWDEAHRIRREALEAVRRAERLREELLADLEIEATRLEALARLGGMTVGGVE